MLPPLSPTAFATQARVYELAAAWPRFGVSLPVQEAGTWGQQASTLARMGNNPRALSTRRPGSRRSRAAQRQGRGAPRRGQGPSLRAQIAAAGWPRVRRRQAPKLQAARSRRLQRRVRTLAEAVLELAWQGLDVAAATGASRLAPDGLLAPVVCRTTQPVPPGQFACTGRRAGRRRLSCWGTHMSVSVPRGSRRRCRCASGCGSCGRRTARTACVSCCAAYRSCPFPCRSYPWRLLRHNVSGAASTAPNLVTSSPPQTRKRRERALCHTPWKSANL